VNQAAVIYARVSSHKQEREGYSIIDQLGLLNEYAVMKGFKIVKEFTDNETATREGRTKFSEMIKFLKQNKVVKIILVEKTDRLYLNFKDYVLLDEFTDLEVHSVEESRIFKTKQSTNFDSVDLIFFCYESLKSARAEYSRRRAIEEKMFAVSAFNYAFMCLETVINRCLFSQIQIKQSSNKEYKEFLQKKINQNGVSLKEKLRLLDFVEIGNIEKIGEIRNSIIHSGKNSHINNFSYYVSKLACIEMIELVKKLIVEYSEEFAERLENKKPFVIASATYETGRDLV
jgi:predicted site-specific integrase-resolvase